MKTPPPPPSLFPRGRCFRKYTPAHARQTSSTSSLSTVQKKLQNASDFYAVPIPEILEDSTFLATNFPRSGASPFLSREERRKEGRKKEGKKVGLERSGAQRAHYATAWRGVRRALPRCHAGFQFTDREYDSKYVWRGVDRWDRLLSLSPLGYESIQLPRSRVNSYASRRVSGSLGHGRQTTEAGRLTFPSLHIAFCFHLTVRKTIRV